MKKLLFVLLLISSVSVFSLEITRVENVDLKRLYLYKGSQQWIAPEDGVIIYVKGEANKRVKFKTKEDGVMYLTQGVRIEALRAKRSVILLDDFGEGKFEIGFSLVGEKKVSGKYKKKIKYEIEYVK
ncbi:MAG: hypothetical protein WBG30_07775 [Psychrilyobacter sp.]|uniref:hypothetical protein n=1 Tax=Psychrilyobacter sp. TaxID=2586924 RepID=UPI003C7898EE